MYYKLYAIRERDTDESEYKEFITTGNSIDELIKYVKQHINNYKENTLTFVIYKDDEEVFIIYKYYSNIIVYDKHKKED